MVPWQEQERNEYHVQVTRLTSGRGQGNSLGSSEGNDGPFTDAAV